MAVSSPKQKNKNIHSGNWSFDGDVEVWRKFSSPNSDEDFCQAWLALLCRQLSNVTAGVVLFKSTEVNAFLPVAVWPEASRDLSFLSEVAERALTEGRGVVHHPEDHTNQTVHVAYPIEFSNQMMGAVVLEGMRRSEADIHVLLRQLHWSMAWLYGLFSRREIDGNQKKSERIGSVMEVVATALRRGRLQKILFDITNNIVQHLNCARVTIGLVSGHSVRVSALSNSAWFEKNASTTQLYKAAMFDAYMEMEPITYLVSNDAESESVAKKNSAHARLAQESGAKSIISLPLLVGADCVGVITLEKDTTDIFSEEECQWLDALATLLAAVIDQKRTAERGYFAKSRDDCRFLMERLFGSRYLIWKFSAALSLTLVLALIFVEMDYRVSAKTVVEGEVQLTAVAPFDGFIKSSYVRAGDTVKTGQVLCRLDDSNLNLELNKWSSERDQYDRKLREAIANHKMSDVQVISAQLKQSEAQFELAKYRLEHVEVIAPFDGVVISGDLSQLIGSPVELGKELFEIAPLGAFRVILQVDESEMRHLALGQKGKLLISGIVDDPIPFSVNKITAMATAKDGRNFFRVEAKLDSGYTHLRPGMEGIGKITVGEQKLWWILTHSFTDWLRISLWDWLP